jgi:hypothetical protein
VIGDVLVAGNQVTVAVLPMVNAVTDPGDTGGPDCGVTEIGELESDDMPAVLADTVTEYSVELVRPLIVHDVVVDWHEKPPGSAIAM